MNDYFPEFAFLSIVLHPLHNACSHIILEYNIFNFAAEVFHINAWNIKTSNVKLFDCSIKTRFEFYMNIFLAIFNRN